MNSIKGIIIIKGGNTGIRNSGTFTKNIIHKIVTKQSLARLLISSKIHWQSFYSLTLFISGLSLSLVFSYLSQYQNLFHNLRWKLSQIFNQNWDNPEFFRKKIWNHAKLWHLYLSFIRGVAIINKRALISIGIESQ